jgi:shikimate kinase
MIKIAKKKKRIVLIGFRGAGKSTIGKLLADKLGWKLISTDQLIEEQAEMSIMEIIKKYGWQQFRQWEEKKITEICHLSKVIIDTGGGVVENQKNMKLLVLNALIAWINADLETLFERLSFENARPALNSDNLKQDIYNNYQRRLPIYQRYCQLFIDTSVDSPEVSCQKIIEEIDVS